jgi:hypothetical protein
MWQDFLKRISLEMTLQVLTQLLKEMALWVAALAWEPLLVIIRLMVAVVCTAEEAVCTAEVECTEVAMEAAECTAAWEAWEECMAEAGCTDRTKAYLDNPRVTLKR